jgi:sugar/nucleoside kinase (ribokinase family)
MTTSPLLIVGSIAIDTIRTPGGTASDQLGGSASFAALTAKHWTNPLILSAIGADFAPALLKRLEKAGLNLKHLTRGAGKSFRWEGVYDENLGTRTTIGIDLGVMDTASLQSPDLSGVRFAMMATYSPSKELEILPRLPKDCFVAVDTIAVYINVPQLRVELDKLVSRATLLCIDQTELKEFTGVADEAAAVKKIFTLGPRWAIIKYGKQGSRLYAPGGQTAVLGIYDNLPKDTTGAGDTFLAGVMAHLANVGKTDFQTILEGMRLGTAAASVTTEAFGVDELIKATREEIERRAREVK